MAKADLAVKGARLLLALCMPPLLTACASRGELLGTIGGADAAAADAPLDAPAATPRFGPPTLIAELADPAAIDEDPTFTGDLLELYFMSTRAGTRDIWVSRRAGAEVAWGAPALVAELSSAASDWAPAVSLDGLFLWFATDRDGPEGHIWVAARPSRADPWGSPLRVAELASAAVDFAPAVDATGTTLFFSSNRPGGAAYDIYGSTRATSGSGSAATWATPALVPGINSDSDEYDPFVAQGGLVVFFTSMRSGAGDLFWSTRRSTETPFQAPTPLFELNSPDYDSDATLSPDLIYMMFSSTRSGSAELYEARAER
jgi:Tol biopolymer transport system component